MNGVLQHLCRVALSGFTDRELLSALVTRRDEAAFEALLHRHGPMVLSVCRRTLGNDDDAEDAFQATFLVLIRKAASIRKSEVIGSWLYGVAYRTARKARDMKAKRHRKERQAAACERPELREPDADLDAALSALPDKYRVPVVLCELEGRSRREAALQLKIPEGTLSSRLATARKLLAKHLRQREQAFCILLPTVALPASTARDTLVAAGRLLSGEGLAEVVSTKVVALTEGMVKTMFVHKLRAMLAVSVVVGVLTAGTGRFTLLPLAEGPASAREEPREAPGAADEALREVLKARQDLTKTREDFSRAAAALAAAQARLAEIERMRHEALQKNASKNEKEARQAAASAIAAKFKYRVPFEIGQTTDNKDGSHIEITDVWGTRPQIEVGGHYIVHGRYVLDSHGQGKLYFYETASGWGGTGPNLDTQQTSLDKSRGEFTLMHEMRGPGYFHLQLFGPGDSKELANVYFGTGDNVARPK
jgi:RNA polymerase sigma factor (sigma-70 family)